MGRCGGDAVLMAAEIGMLAKGAVDAALAVYDGLKLAVGMGSAGGGFRLVSIAGGGQTVLAPAGVAVAEGTVEGILGGVAEGSLSGFGFHTINDFLDNLAKIDADRVFEGEGSSAALNDWVNRIPELEKQAPIEIPSNATVKVQAKNGYDQISFKWTENGQNYEVRWHTKTPGAPEGQGNT